MIIIITAPTNLKRKEGRKEKESAERDMGASRQCPF